MKNTFKVSEDQIQAEFIRGCKLILPEIEGLLFSVPNGGVRDIRTALKLKRTGTVAGIPDILFCWKGKTYFLEFKTAKGVLSENQKVIHQKLKDQGFDVYIVRSAVEGIKLIQSILNNN